MANQLYVKSGESPLVTLAGWKAGKHATLSKKILKVRKGQSEWLPGVVLKRKANQLCVKSAELHHVTLAIHKTCLTI